VRNLGKADAARRAVSTEVDPDDRLTVVAADLAADDGWPAAVAGCDFVLHIASPMVAAGEGDETLGSTAREGMLRGLRAAVEAGARRVVATSSTAACTPAKPPGRPIDESDWTDPEEPGLAAYRRSKAIAERAAWDFIEGKATRLTTILPGAIF